MPRIAVAGLIGSGKSTLCKRLGRCFGNNAILIKEPVQEWEKSGFLKAFYFISENRKPDDPVRVLFASFFQSAVLTSKLAEMKRALGSLQKDDRLVIFDSHPICDRAFMSLVPEIEIDGAHLDLQAWYCEQILRPTIELVSPMPDFFIYLDTPIDTCMQNIKNRLRPGEEGIPREYLERLDAAFKKHVLAHLKELGIPVIKINSTGSNTKKESFEEAIQHINARTAR